MMIGQINDNISTLEEIVREMDAIRKNCGGGIPAEGLPMYFIDMIGGYRSIDYDYSRPEKGGREDDPRKGKSDEVKTHPQTAARGCRLRSSGFFQGQPAVI